MDPAVTTGAFTLGGVALGAVLKWTADAGRERRAAAQRRDDTLAGLVDACVRLSFEARSLRQLDTTSSKLRQLGLGMMAYEAQRPVALAPNLWAGLTQLLTGALADGFQHLHPVKQADAIRSNLMPLLSEVTVLTVRLSTCGDEHIKDACTRVGTAAGALLENITERQAAYAKRETELQAALRQLRRARDAASARWWRRRNLRRRIDPAGEDQAVSASASRALPSPARQGRHLPPGDRSREPGRR